MNAISKLLLMVAEQTETIAKLTLELIRLRHENIELKQYALELDRELQGRKQHHWN